MSRVKINLEYLFRASPAILYRFITTPECLVRWFCDGVDIQEDVYTYDWEGSEEVAEMVDDIEEERIRFEWEDCDPGEYLEYRMYKSDVTNETILEISDFCDDDEIDEQTLYWNELIKKLRAETGG